MKRILIALFAAMALATVAFASSLPQSGTVVVTNDSGVQVGSGTISNGQFNLTLTTGTTGFVTITVTSAGGETESYQAMVGADGQITVVHDSQFEDLTSFAGDSGIDSVDVTESENSQASGGDASSTSADASCQEQDPEHTATGTQSTGTATSCSDSTDASGSDSTASASGGDDSVHVGTSLGSGSDSSSTESSDDSGSHDD